ncbi:MAG: hypothetical protein WBA61_16515 [Aequorivita sp.]
MGICFPYYRFSTFPGASGRFRSPWDIRSVMYDVRCTKYVRPVAVGSGSVQCSVFSGQLAVFSGSWQLAVAVSSSSWQ